MNYNWIKTDYPEKKDKNLVLYEQDKDNVYVYKLNPNSSLMEDYKRNEMRKIPENERIFSLSHFKGFSSPLFFSNRKWSYMTDQELFTNKQLANIPEASRELLERYYKRTTPTDGRTYILIENSSNGRYKETGFGEKYFILPEINRKQSFLSSELKMENILNVPQTLFNLENFLLCEFDALTDEDIDSISYLFTKENITTFNIEMLQDLEKIGLSENIMANLNNKINKTQRVLKRF